MVNAYLARCCHVKYSEVGRRCLFSPIRFGSASWSWMDWISSHNAKACVSASSNEVGSFQSGNSCVLFIYTPMLEYQSIIDVVSQYVQQAHIHATRCRNHRRAMYDTGEVPLDFLFRGLLPVRHEY